MKCQGSESQNIIKQEVNSNHEGQETDRHEMMRQHIDSTDMKSQIPSSSITIAAEVHASDIKSQVTDTQGTDVPQMLTSNMNGGNMELSGTDNNYNWTDLQCLSYAECSNANSIPITSPSYGIRY